VVHKLTTGQEFTDRITTAANPSEMSYESNESLGYKLNLLTSNIMEALSWSAKLYWTLVCCWQVLYKAVQKHLCLLTSFHT